ncbi:hypothetical protein LTR62_001438 [Meristemomyces frigidus]|uniref:Aquaporin-like protein n=1 Tax=Meristemomyces frigidus TaxID=1508187 RepID=A0AAN7YLN4_9PEZI|nr:hypothetical protein LTR62_001438 [Meristemomyces frigidus]
MDNVQLHTTPGQPSSISGGWSEKGSYREGPATLADLPAASASHHEQRPPTPQSPDVFNSLKKTTSDLTHARQLLGLQPSAPVIEEHDVAEHSRLAWSKVKILLREPFAEFFGTFILVLFGDGSVAQVLLSAGQKSAPGGDGYGNYQSINWGWGLGVMLGIYVRIPILVIFPTSIPITGAYLNPAITLTNCLLRKLPWRRFPIYFLAQFLGGLVAAAVVYANYINEINAFEGHNVRTVPPSKTATAGIFCTYPQQPLTKASQFFSEFIASRV